MKRSTFLTVFAVMLGASTCYSQPTDAGASMDASSSGTDTSISGSATSGSASPGGSASSPSSTTGAGAGGASGAELGLGAESQSEAIDFASTGNIKINRMGEKAPAGMNALAQGEIVNIDRANNKVTIRDSRTGSNVRYTVSDSKLLKDLSQGDRVQVFSDASAK